MTAAEIAHKVGRVPPARSRLSGAGGAGQIGEATENDVTVRAMISSLGRFGIAAAEEVKALDRRWAAHRKQNGSVGATRDIIAADRLALAS